MYVWGPLLSCVVNYVVMIVHLLICQDETALCYEDTLSLYGIFSFCDIGADPGIFQTQDTGVNLIHLV